MRYMVVIGKADTGYGAHVPELPGCLAVAGPRKELMRLIKATIDLHIEGLQKAGEPIPPPSSAGEFVEVDAA